MDFILHKTKKYWNGMYPRVKFTYEDHNTEYWVIYRVGNKIRYTKGFKINKKETDERLFKKLEMLKKAFIRTAIYHIQYE